MIPIDHQHPPRRHSSIAQYPQTLPPPPIPPQLPSSSSASSLSVSPHLTYGAVSSSPLTNDPTEQACEKNKRSAHNALERQRREGLNSKFQQLAHALPGLQNIRRPSKSMVVGKSLEFVTRSVQRDSYYKNKIRQLRKEHDTLRKHTQRSQQYLKKRMNEAEDEKNIQQKTTLHAKSESTVVISASRRTSSSSSSGVVASPEGGKKKSSPDQQQEPDLPAIKRHKSRSSSSLNLAKKSNTTTTNVRHKFVHHHTSSSNAQEKPAQEKPHHNKSTRPPPTTTTFKTENVDPAMVVMSPQQRGRYTPSTTNSTTPSTTCMLPIQLSWPPLDLSALQPPSADEGLAFYSPVELYNTTTATSMVFDGISNLPPETSTTVNNTTTSIPCNIAGYIAPSNLSNISHPDPGYAHHYWK